MQPDHHDIAISVSHGPNRRTILFRNRHKVEFAIFDKQEAPAGKVERYLACWRLPSAS